MSAHLLLALIRSRGHAIVESESGPTAARIKAKRGDNGEQMTVEWTMEQASKVRVKEGDKMVPLSETSRYRNYPEDMLWARCVSRLYRRLFSDAAFGATVYVPEDFGITGDEAADASTFTDEQIAAAGVMQGMYEFVPRPEDGKPMADLVKKEILGKVMRDQNLPAWKECTKAQQEAAIAAGQDRYLQSLATLSIEGDGVELTFEQARDVLNLARDGTLPEPAEEGEVTEPETAPDPLPADVVDAEEVPEPSSNGQSPVDEALEEQRWAELIDLMERDPTGGTNADIEHRTRKLYRLMGELGMWADDQLHTDLANRGKAHYSDLGRKAEYQKFAQAAHQVARQSILQARDT
jgi:hypothetical protein